MEHSLPLYNQTFYPKEELTADVQHHLDPLKLNAVLSAFEMASNVHEFQLRNDASLYFWHLSRVARIVIRELEYYDADVIAASLLHDVLEDSNIITKEVITFNFGTRVCHIVEILTKNLQLTDDQMKAEEERYIKTIRESDIDCKIVKFAERLDNFRCLEFGVKRNPFKYIEDTEKLYFPMAEEVHDSRLNKLVATMKLIKGKLVA